MKETKAQRQAREAIEQLQRMHKPSSKKEPVVIAPPKAKTRKGASSFPDVSTHALALDLMSVMSEDHSATPSGTVPLPPVEANDYPQRKPSRRGSRTESLDRVSGIEPVPKIEEKHSATPSGTDIQINESVDAEVFAGSTTPSEKVSVEDDAPRKQEDTPNSATPSGTVLLPPVEALLPGQWNDSTTPSGTDEKASATPSGIEFPEVSQSPGVVEAKRYPQQNRSTTPSSFDPKAPKKKKTAKREVELLRGLQLEFMRYVFDKCCAEPPYKTPPLKLREIALATGSSENTADYNYAKLREKGLIVRAGKDGPIILEIPANLFTLVGKKLFTTPQRNGSTTPSGMGSYARAVVVDSLRENPEAATARVGATGERSSLSNEDQATARQPTPTTTENSPKSKDAKDWRRSDYKWAYALVIPEIMQKARISHAQLLEFERYEYDFAEVQQSVDEFAEALKRKYYLKKVNKKADWNSIPAFFLESMRKKGYFTLAELYGPDSFNETDDMDTPF